jgi:predicted transporter
MKTINMKWQFKALLLAIIIASLSASLIEETYTHRGYFAVGGECILILLIIYGGVHALSKDFKCKTKRG